MPGDFGDRLLVSLARVTHPVIARAAACLAACVVTAVTAIAAPGAAPAASAAPKRAVDDSPLGVTLDTMTPSVIPRRGPITLSGEVTNRSDDTWTDLQVYLFHSATPITSRTGLADAVETEADADVGGRVTDEGRFDEIGDLAPGETTSYSVTVRRSDLAISGAPGVYWVGTHVLGAVDGVRDGFAAGRARSFMPLLEPQTRKADVAVVVPLRERVRRGTDGSLLGLGQWHRALASDGRLGRLGLFAADSEGPMTWLVDPAVLDAVGSVAADNPPISTAPDGSGPGGASEPSESPAASPSAEASQDGSGDSGSDEGGEQGQEPTAEAQEATGWLESFLADAGGDALFALPYGDVDVPAVAGNHLDGILESSERLSADSMARLGTAATPVIAPPSGYLTRSALAAADPGTAVLMSDLAFPTVEDTVVGQPDGTEIVLSDSAAASGGPGPQSRTNLLAVRQRILADAALNALAPGRAQPLVVSLPPRFDPGEDWQTADFFGGLDVPWLRQVDLLSLLDKSPRATTEQAPLYPASQRDAHIPLANQLATQELGELGRVYADLLTENDGVADELAKVGMLASSYDVRDRPGAALTRARSTAVRVRRTMQRVVIDGPPFVMMSSETGPISVTVENQLDEPVTVRLTAETRSTDLRISTPDPITLGPGQRAPVRLRADSTSIGVHAVTMVATTEDGSPLGSQAQFNVRTSNVGTVIWFILGGGIAVLALAIVVRLVRRIRNRGGSPADDDADRPAAQPDSPTAGAGTSTGAGTTA